MIRLQIFVLILALILVAGCGSSEPVLVPVEEPIVDEGATPSAMFGIFQNQGDVAQNNSLNYIDPVTQTGTVLGQGGVKTFAAVSDDGQSVALAVANGKTSNLYVYNVPSGVVSALFSGSSELVYTGHWDLNSATFYFGAYTPEGKRMGPGSIHSYSVESGATRQIPCSASRSVLAVMPGGTLIVRNSDSIYEVATQDCATLKTFDARKMYHVAVSPIAGKMAFVLRDLVFNRETRAYEPDSTLYLQEIGGGKPVKIVGEKYQPRNISWSSDGTELIFDVDALDGSRKRAISIYSIASASSSYLEAPTSIPDSRSQPVFSPDGRHVLFTATNSASGKDLMWKTTGESFSHVIPGDDEQTAAYQFEWIGKDLLFLMSPKGEAHVLDLSSEGGTILWSGTQQDIFALRIQ